MTQKTIDSRNLAIEKLFEDFYIIPSYQREYIWKEKQVLELLSDVYNEFSLSSEIESNEYFLGSIVVCPSVSDSDNVYEVIDGQQRLTTSYILFCVIKNYMKHSIKSQQPVDSIKRLIFADYTNTQGQDISRYKVNPQYPDSKNVLEKFSEDEFDLEQLEKSNGYQTEPAINLMSAYRTIEDFVEEKFNVDESQIRRFYAHFIKKIKLVRVETTDINHALRVFETINNRGIGLDSMNLLKNLLFNQIDKSDFQRISDKWKEIKNKLDEVQEKPMNFLRYFILSQYDVDRDKVQSKEYQWLRENNEICKYQEKSFEFVDRLLTVTKAYTCLLNQKNIDDSDNQNLINIKYLIPNAKQHIILLLAAMKLSKDCFNFLTSEIENLLFVYTFLDKKVNELEKPFIDWASKVAKITNPDEEAQKEEIKNFIEQEIIPNKQQFKSEFEQKFSKLSQLDFNSIKSDSKPGPNANKKTKYILGKLTQYIQLRAYPNEAEPKELKYFTQSSIEIEHILSQTPTVEVVNNFDKKHEIESYTYNFGNLDLLEKSINSSIQNNNFETKKESCRESKFILTKVIFGKLRIGLNTTIDKSVETLTSFNEWNSKSIETRQAELAKLAIDILYPVVS